MKKYAHSQEVLDTLLTKIRDIEQYCLHNDIAINLISVLSINNDGSGKIVRVSILPESIHHNELPTNFLLAILGSRLHLNADALLSTMRSISELEYRLEQEEVLNSALHDLFNDNPSEEAKH